MAGRELCPHRARARALRRLGKPVRYRAGSMNRAARTALLRLALTTVVDALAIVMLFIGATQRGATRVGLLAAAMVILLLAVLFGGYQIGWLYRQQRIAAERGHRLGS